MAEPKTRYKLPPDADAGILERNGKGDSLREICAWVQTTYGVSISPTGVRKRLAKLRAARTEVTKTIVREKLGKTVLSDIDVLDVEKRRLRKLARLHFRHAVERVESYFEGKSPTELYCIVSERLRKVIETKLHYAGADSPDDGAADRAAAGERLAGKLARLGSPEDAGVPAEPDRGGSSPP